MKKLAPSIFLWSIILNIQTMNVPLTYTSISFHVQFFLFFLSFHAQRGLANLGWVETVWKKKIEFRALVVMCWVAENKELQSIFRELFKTSSPTLLPCPTSITHEAMLWIVKHCSVFLGSDIEKMVSYPLFAFIRRGSKLASSLFREIHEGSE